jgi:signal peptidase II
MRKYSRALLSIIIVLTFIGCDQATKSYAIREIPRSSSNNQTGEFIRFQFAENEGYFLGIGSTLPATFRTSITITMTVLAITGFVVLLLFARRISIAHLIAYSLLLAGSFGNLVDRLFHHGMVIDFIILGTRSMHTGILNIADLLITGSLAVLLMLEILRQHAG